MGVILRYILIVLLSIMPTEAMARSYYANPDTKWQAHVDLNLRGGQDRNIGRVDFMIPIMQNDTTMFFTDIRAMGDSRDAREGNFGLGLRKIFNHSFILGGYGFYDRKITKSDHYFNQGVIGGELLTDWFDVRSNYYFNTGKEHREFVDTAPTASFSGNIINITQTTQLVSERILGGFDAEFGMKNIIMPEAYEGRAYIGYFNFKESFHPRIEGMRFRYEQKLKDWLFVEYEAQEDQIRGATSYGGIRLRHEFNKPKNKKPLTNIEKRMTTKIYRDIDAVSSQSVTGGGSTAEPLTITDASGNPVPGLINQVQRVVHFDNNAAGSTNQGTAENPCTDLACVNTQLAAAGAGTILYLHAGSTLATGTSHITLFDNQKILSTGFAFSVIKDGVTVPIIPFNSNRGTITGSPAAVSQTVIASANECEIAGIQGTLTGASGSNFISLMDNSGFNIHDNIINYNANGITINTTSVASGKKTVARINNNSFICNTGTNTGILFFSNAPNYHVDSINNNTLQGEGTKITASFGVAAHNSYIVSISNNVISSTATGIVIGIGLNHFATTNQTTIVENNEIKALVAPNPLSVAIQPGSAGTNSPQYLIRNNTISDFPFGIGTFTGAIHPTILATGNTLTRNDVGIRVGGNAASGGATITGNTITGTGTNTAGIHVITPGNAASVVNIMNNAINNNAVGIKIHTSQDYAAIDFGNGVTFGADPGAISSSNMGSNTGTNTLNVGN